MTTRLPQVGKLSIPGKSAAALEELVTEIRVEYSTDQVSELSIVIVDPKHLIAKSPLANPGSNITFDGETWTVASIDGQAMEWGSEITMRARDPLARSLRKTYKTSAEQKVSPGDWVKNRVKKAGGTATVQPSSKRAVIAQSKNQSSLDVIGSFAGDLDWSWTSYAGKFIFGSRHYAWQGKFGLPSWSFTWDGKEATDVLTAEWSDSIDNSENERELTITVPYEAGRKVRPWHRLQTTIPGASGVWLVESVSINHDGVTPVQITATKPVKPSPKPGSGSKES